MSPENSPTFQFGPFRLEIGERRLLREGSVVPLPSRNHLVLEHEAAWQIMVRELEEFLGWS